VKNTVIPPLENLICQVCRVSFFTQKRSFKRHPEQDPGQTVDLAWGLCSQHRQLFSLSFIALIEFDPKRSSRTGCHAGWCSELMYRTGHFAHIKRQIFNEIFSVIIEDDQACVFVEMSMINGLKAKAPDAFFLAL
jgi:hypothetical protein